MKKYDVIAGIFLSTVVSFSAFGHGPKSSIPADGGVSGGFVPPGANGGVIPPPGFNIPPSFTLPGGGNGIPPGGGGGNGPPGSVPGSPPGGVIPPPGTVPPPGIIPPPGIVPPPGVIIISPPGVISQP